MRKKSCHHKGFYHYEMYCDKSIHRYRVCYQCERELMRDIE